MLTHPSSLVREAAAFCLKSLLTELALPGALSKLTDDPSPRIRDVARFLTNKMPVSSQPG
jgi:HEAT repeat protein